MSTLPLAQVLPVLEMSRQMGNSNGGMAKETTRALPTEPHQHNTPLVMSGILAEVGLTFVYLGGAMYFVGLISDLLTQSGQPDPYADMDAWGRYKQPTLDEPQIIVIPIGHEENYKPKTSFKLNQEEYTEFKRKLMEGQRRRVEAHKKLDYEMDKEERERKLEQHPNITSIKKEKATTEQAIDLTTGEDSSDEETQILSQQ